jgi:hypothetical protein
MAIVFYTAAPKVLLDAIYKAIDEGDIDNWVSEPDGDLTIEQEEWHQEAWLRPFVFSGMLQFGLVGKRGVMMTKSIYGVYHGRFIEEILVHFDDKFSTVTATAIGQTTLDDFRPVAEV